MTRGGSRCRARSIGLAKARRRSKLDDRKEIRNAGHDQQAAQDQGVEVGTMRKECAGSRSPALLRFPQAPGAAHRVSLALEGARLERNRVDRVADESVGLRAEQDLSG